MSTMVQRQERGIPSPRMYASNQQQTTAIERNKDIPLYCVLSGHLEIDSDEDTRTKLAPHQPVHRL